MRLQFETENIEIEELDVGVLVVGFYTEDNYLMIQHSLGEFDDEDADLGMNTYHIERDDQSFGGYGGVQKVSLHPDFLEVELDETGKANLECDSARVDFQTDDETFGLLTEKLKLIFGNSLVIVQ